MQMSDAEIVRSYKNAKDKRSQVGVLAELNACSKDLIREILSRNGIDAPKPGRKAVLTDKAKILLKTEEPESKKMQSANLETPEQPRALKNEPSDPKPEETPDELIELAENRMKSLQEDREARERDIQIMQSIVDDYKRREEKLQEWLEKHKKGGTS